MKKATNIAYYISTVLLSVSYIFASYTEIARWQAGVDLMQHLGYPIYLLTILGVAKALAVIGIWQRISPTLREWAYAGISINLIGAIVSHIAVGDSFIGSAPALLNLVIATISYVTMRRRFNLAV